MSLTVVISPMFAGKTTFLLNKIVGLTKLGFKTLYVNHAIDNRNEEASISCHNKLLESGLVSCSFDVIKCDSLDVLKNVDKDYIFIDEFQFFQKENVVELINNLVKSGKHIFVAGLKGDYKNQEFGSTLKLIPHADNVIVLKSLCVACAKDGRCIDAPFTKYVKNNDHNQITVGADDLYVPVCREHYSC
jgi:thymidine kinase